MSNKRGQEASGGGAAALVAIITLLIILYVLFIPPSEREKILKVNESSSGTSASNGTSSGGVEYNKTLLAVQPGKIYYVAQNEIEHDLPSINLYTKTEGMVIKEVNSIAVKKALFMEKKQNMTFELDYPEQTKNVLLSFNVLRSYGELIIKLNGQEIFNGEIKGMPNPIKLPVELLKKVNSLEFEAASIGLVFWKVNDYVLENVKITGDITEMSASESKSIFLVNKNEKDNLDKSSVTFSAGCDIESVGRLFVEINGYDIFTGVPDCGQIRTYQFSPDKLMQGENIIRFKTEKGHYLLDRIVVKTELTEPEQYAWFFQLNDAEFNSASNNSIKINMTAEFVDDSYKEGYFVINGYETGFSSKRMEESWIINPYVKRGGNTIKLDPKNNMFITELSVVIR